MKKLILAMAAMMLVVAVQADLVSRVWTSQPLYTGSAQAPGDTSADGGAVDYLGELSIGLLVPGVANATIWYDGAGYYVGGFQFEAVEADAPTLTIYNAATAGAATAFLTSLPLVLPDIEGIPGVGATDVNFDFTGAEWQVIPEPATIGLMGIAGLGLFLARKKTTRI